MTAALSGWSLALLATLVSGQDYPWVCNGPEYLALPAADKAARVWENCLVDTTSQAWAGIVEIGEMMFEDMCLSFNTEGDELPKQFLIPILRPKSIHSVGTVAKVEWVDLGGHPYTGIFQGATEGIARLSLAAEPTTTELNTKPGMGLKFLRDGMDSANMVAMFSVGGQESWNFFANDFTNHIPGITGLLQILAAKFYTATNNIRQVGISNWAMFGQEGVEVADPVFPYRLIFRPTGEIVFPDTYVQPFTDDLKTIPEGSILYEIYALDLPEELGGAELHIGDLVTRSEMTTSLWGDQHLFFRHDDEAHDLVLKPEWNEFVPQYGDYFEDDPSKSSKCPYSK